MSSTHHEHAGFHGPKCWMLSLIAGLILGAILASILPKVDFVIPQKAHTLVETNTEIKVQKTNGNDAAELQVHATAKPNIPLYLCLPFALLLLSIALMPFVNLHFWEYHYPDFAFFLGGSMIAYYTLGLTYEGFGIHRLEHVGLEYFQFIALVGGLYVVTGGIHLEVKGKGGPVVNAAMLAIGAVIANLCGTTGAAALLIRAYLKVNKQRIKPFHVVFFIFVVANCGGCLTPIGDPPLFLGFLQGIPFQWTIIHCFPYWLLINSLLIVTFYLLDKRSLKKHLAEHPQTASDEPTAVKITGLGHFALLGAILLGVFLDIILTRLLDSKVVGVGALFQLFIAVMAFKLASKENLKANEFTFAPIKEVAFLFIGLFATMVPALDYLDINAASLGVNTPGKFYWFTGLLSSFLDNAPTYLTFLQTAHGLVDVKMGPPTTYTQWLPLPNSAEELLAISLAAVFFGANTYIGNAPNFMVKAIAETSGVKMPSFFGYLAYSVVFLMPLLIVIYLLLGRL